jgi:hypothetical protein
MADGWRDFVSVARDQMALVTLEQATAAGVSPASLAYAVEQGRLTRQGRGIVGIGGAPPSWEQDLLAGALRLGEGAVISYRAGGRVLRFDGYPVGPLDFTVLRGRTPVHKGLVVHTTRSLPAIDKVTVGPFRVTSGARTIIDLARVASRDELERAVDSALRDGWTSEAYLRRRLQAMRGSGRAGVRLLDEVLNGRPLGAASFLEREFRALIDRAGLPRPECQVVHGRGGRVVARVDFEFPGTDLVVEVAGHCAHATRRQRQRDAQRIAELTIIGLRVITFTYEDVMERPGYVVATLRAALAASPRVRSSVGFHEMVDESDT